jgi:hypothetical protein
MEGPYSGTHWNLWLLPDQAMAQLPVSADNKTMIKQ